MLIDVEDKSIEADAVLGREVRLAVAKCARDMEGIRIESCGLTSDLFPPCHVNPKKWEVGDEPRERCVDPLFALLRALQGLSKKLDEEGMESRVR